MQALDWDGDENLAKWLAGKDDKERRIYKYAMRRYAEYTGYSPEQMLIEKENDLKLPPRKQGQVEQRLKEYFKWLQTEYVGPKGKHLASKSALAVVAIIAGFYSSHKLKLDFDWKEDFKASPKTVNATEKMSASQVEKLASFAPELRDKAIIWCMFQGLMDISTVTSLNYGDIEKEILDPPMGAIMIRDIVREKEEVRHNTLIYKTAVKHLRMYLEERAGKEFWKVLKYDDPLFLGRSGKRHGSKYIQDMLREIAPLTFIANSRFDHADINPLRPHSLRASGNDQMAKAGAVKELRDFLMGHEVDFDCAYFGGEEGLRKSYVQYAELALEPKGIPPDVESALEKQKATVDSLASMYTEEKKRREELEGKLTRLEKRDAEYEKRFGKLEADYYAMKRALAGKTKLVFRRVAKQKEEPMT